MDRLFHHETIIRSELFSPERLEQHAASLAESHRLAVRPPTTRLLEKRLKKNDAVLRDIYRKIGKAIGEASELPPAAEWLVDNYFILEEQIRGIRDDLPPAYYRQLPKLADGYLAGYPRVYGIAWAYIAHTDSFFNPKLLERFIRAYQQAQPLNIGELWAIAITLRIALVENLRRAATLIIDDRQARAAADRLADRLLAFVDSDSTDLAAELKLIDRATLSSAFAVQLIQRLRDQNPRVLPMLQRVEERLRQQHSSGEEIVRAEHQNQGALTVTVRNIITSMRSISAFDWVEFFESVSLVDHQLRAASAFGAMDLATRNLYRNAVEKLAARSVKSEIEVTAIALQAAGDPGTGPAAVTPRLREVGYYLIDKGVAKIKPAIDYRATWRDQLRAAPGSANFALYVLVNILLVIGIVELGLAGSGARHRSLALLLAMGCAIFFPAYEAAISIVNRLIVSLFAPTILPGMALRDGVPAGLRTMVAVPVLLGEPADIKAQIERLEVHYLGNADGDVRFALLSDWKDAPAEAMPLDAGQLTMARDAVARLNRRHPMTGELAGMPRFFLFHRRRQWNAREGKWLGWERKRGKLHEFNRLLRGATDTGFLTDAAAGFAPPPSAVRYVVTLDADTRLPRGAVKRLVGKLAHPLNHARIDPASGLVTEGYGILQPRVASTLPQAATRSFFQSVFYSASGIDPYAFAISDVYQDLFEEGSFTGKGIYDVDAFEQSVTGRIPENAVLSHDLLEGIFARAGLASDVEVVEDFPSRYDVATSRQHRWARGDWQLLPWIFGRRSGGIPPLGHWKMLDNLRRSLTAPFAMLALLIGWHFPPGAACLWTALVVIALTMPLLLGLLEGVRLRHGASKSSHVLNVGKDTVRVVQQAALILTFLPHQAWLMLDAVGRTVWRLAVSRRHLLEWVTAADVKVSRLRTIGGFYTYMAGGLLLTALAVLAAVWQVAGRAVQWPVAVPFLLLWGAAPAIAQLASRPGRARRRPLTAEATQQFRLIGRATWRFFDRFVTAADNHLPPDNFQEDPLPVVAHRTSPTNIGLYLLTVIAAQDFGWTGLTETLGRLQATCGTLAGMERYRGHFYNWYDTLTARPLLPRYISSVDSGNLAGYLIVLTQACRECWQQPVLNPGWRAGLRDTVLLIQRSLSLIPPEQDSATRITLREAVAQLLHILTRDQAATLTLPASRSALTELALLASGLCDIAAISKAEQGARLAPADLDLLQWSAELQAAIDGHLRDLRRYTPWVEVLGQLASEGHALPAPLLGLLTGPVPTLANIAERSAALARLLHSHAATLPAAQQVATVPLQRALQAGREAAQADGEQWQELAKLAMQWFHAMDFAFLLDPARQLLTIGYRVDDSAPDASFYDLLASEARLASLVAIAKGDIPAHNWFRLGRTVTAVNYQPALVSWSGSMFEYLMPSLVMIEPDESLIGQTNRLVVKRQIQYGNERGIPWGVSESAYNARDFEFTYQYLSFGVPGLGLKRGLSENIVVAPYATALAAGIDPPAVLQNMARMEALGGRGAYGWFEAYDFTGKRLPEDQKLAIVRAYMAHHQGMSLLAILNLLTDGRLRDRFHAEPIIQATELLLQELPPRNVALAHPRSEEVAAVAHIREITPPNPRYYTSPHGPVPRTHLLSNGDYSVMLTAAGSGYSRWNNMAVTRWREDATRDPWGSFVYLRDTENGKVWSAGYQPVCAEPDAFTAAFFEDRAEFIRRDGALVTTLNVVVASEDHGEVRRVSILNQGLLARDIELTSYAELVLTQSATDTAHPAFAKLFVQTEFVPPAGALLATRRRRGPEEPTVWAVHLVSVGGELIGSLQYETDRAQFLGRGRTPRSPQAMDGRPLNDSIGTVLDPVFSLRCRVRVPAGATTHISFWTLTAATRAEALELAEKYRAPSAYNRAAARAWTQAQLQYQHLGMTPDEAHLCQRLANHALYADRALRPNTEVLKRGAGRQSLLWSTGISGDLPIIVLRMDVASDLKTLRQLVRAHGYWQIKRLEVDLVILNEQPTSYLESLQNEIELLVRTSQALPRNQQEKIRGGIFVLRGDHIAPEAKALLLTAARAVIAGHRGSLAEQLAYQSREVPTNRIPRLRPPQPPEPPAPKPAEVLEFFNGIGGFGADGREYVVVLGPGLVTPAPWINVIANPQFGFQVAATGAGYSWAVNSREYKLTPWSNDPVSDEAAEIIYLRDLDSGICWTPTATPIRKDHMTYVARHGFGYSRFETSGYGIETQLTQYVALHDPVKLSTLTLRNRSAVTRRLSVVSYTEWLLGPTRNAAAPLTLTELDPATGAMLAQNPWNDACGDRAAFAFMSGPKVTCTADRLEFIGRNRALHNPVAVMHNLPLSGRVGIGFDPCAVLQQVIEIKPGQAVELTLLLGDGATKAEAQRLAAAYHQRDPAAVLAEVKAYWAELTGQIQVRTPDRAMDIMLNGWLLYQTVVCRVWARSGFYQSSGAYGYRDQLQDTMSLAGHKPDWTRQHLLRAAGRQFPEGDVQHWWLPAMGSVPDAGRGVRTRFADDPLWLVSVAAYYIKVTGDATVLDEQVPFLDGPTLTPEQHENFFMPTIASRTASLYEHCALAIERSLGTGMHGLSLFGGGDWNDGMNRVGIGGTGESVWLSWFLLTVLTEFMPLAAQREPARVAQWEAQAIGLRQALEQNAWDGEWYRRGYYDDGTPLGSAASTECRIDSLAQSWAVISGAAEPERAARGMHAVRQYLVRPDDGLALLFTPAFDQTPQDPGYIKGYPPGIRENGGQYTHAALWSVVAFAKLGDSAQAYGLFSMLNPINHAGSRTASYRYKVEPYVVAADIYSNPQHVGRGGWTWYTGSAGWMYRVGLENILGLDKRGDRLRLNPCIPREWPGFAIDYRFGSSQYRIEVDNSAGGSGIASLIVDGHRLPPSAAIPLIDDGAAHNVVVRLGVAT